MHGPVSAETFNALFLLDSCSVANAIEALDVRLRNEGFSEPRLCCRFLKLPPMVGYATTLRVHVVGFGMPVEVADLQIRPGDLLHGDQNGLVRIPMELANNLPAIATHLREREKQIIASCRSSESSISGLRALIDKGCASKGGNPLSA
jgi:hypothetical protein